MLCLEMDEMLFLISCLIYYYLHHIRDVLRHLLTPAPECKVAGNMAPEEVQVTAFCLMALQTSAMKQDGFRKITAFKKEPCYYIRKELYKLDCLQSPIFMC